MKGCGWMTYHLTVHTISVPMSKRTNKEREGRGWGGGERRGVKVPVHFTSCCW